MSYEMIDEEEGLLIRFRGHVTFDEIAEANDRAQDHEAAQTHRYQIWSFLDAGALDVDNRDIRTIAKTDELYFGRKRELPIKVALVSANRRTKEFLVAYVDYMNSEVTINRVFDNVADARSWVSE